MSSDILIDLLEIQRTRVGNIPITENTRWLQGIIFDLCLNADGYLTKYAPGDPVHPDDVQDIHNLIVELSFYKNPTK